MHEKLQSLTIAPDVSIRDAMLTIERSSLELALVVDGAGRLVGTVTDGDIRRALLAGAGMNDDVLPHVSPRPYTITPKAARAEALDLMRAYGVAHPRSSTTRAGSPGCTCCASCWAGRSSPTRR